MQLPAGVVIFQVFQKNSFCYKEHIRGIVSKLAET